MKRALIFWMWNDTLTEEKICQQLHEFKAKGVEGFFIHPMPSEFRPADFPGGQRHDRRRRRFQKSRGKVPIPGRA